MRPNGALSFSIMSIADLRRDYALESLTEADVDPDPVRQFAHWFDQARRAELLEPNAMTLATSSPAGEPSARVVLLKGFDDDGFVFFTDYRSHKGAELDANPRAALCFWWDALQRQVRIAGAVTKVPAADSARYFRSRPHGSRIGAWASHQSSHLSSRSVLEREVARLAAQYPEGTEIPLPPHWGGYRVIPASIEFWQGRMNRLHDRILYRRAAGGWAVERLSP
jgi:pyridoxamine 5'-phosphate oxidase